ncbi:M20/M25/M40 family metallo-hydrolase [Conexibacter sp. DBS9H8]|uniref:M20/M25/M40 family metallo-hydrolase n=1 Tax=Conexibacter sp. DBS9H8 TaxID=2937801 RepID=UPI00200C6B9E|nr:M20/M25/M40 family metallo-hydrolase [Conexibacter sp. DBS9H8]
MSEPEQERLCATFAALCAIPSPTGQERAVADWITAELTALGLSVVEDDAGEAAGAGAGNLLCVIPGTRDGWMLLCAHLDTVPPTAPLAPRLRDGAYENAEPGILGADNKAAVAALVELLRQYATERPPVGLEVLFTVAEETGLHGAAHCDLTRLSSRFGYVFDLAAPFGEIVTASPTYLRLRGAFRGRAAHAGLHPETGVNAITAAAHGIAALPQGRIDAETTANVGLISGGSATNVVPDRCEIEAEVRSLDSARAAAVMTECVDALQDAADGAGADLDLSVERIFTGYRVRSAEPGLRIAETALGRLGYPPRRVASGGGSDANAFRSRGLAVTNLANGTERPHERGERVTVAALSDGLALLRALLGAAAEHPDLG